MILVEDNNLLSQAQQIKFICAEYGVENVRLFGSFLHKNNINNSDIDLLVDWVKPHDIFERIELKQKLETLLKRPVDLVVAKNLHWKVKDKILAEAKRI